jgi:hypothetical protein
MPLKVKRKIKYSSEVIKIFEPNPIGARPLVVVLEHGVVGNIKGEVTELMGTRLWHGHFAIEQHYSFLAYFCAA